ncbi:MAG: hypothetical protein FD121_622 [Gallionellaceae bacterium]|nr:MAG: hypothetical protein FD121_622 [Gallionellaceae bacterium]
MPSALKSLPPAIIALLLQVAAFTAVLFVVRLFQFQLAPIVFVLLCGLLAATLSHLVKQARWWLYIQLAFLPSMLLVYSLDIPPTLFLVAFVIMLVVYWSAFRTQVPLYLSSNKVWQALETQLPANQSFTFIDLGSGLGGVLTHLAKTHPHGHYHGVEYAPLPFVWSWLRIKLGKHKNCTVQWGSMWDSDLSQYDVVFAYLSPVPMERLWHKARAEMQTESVFISNTFAVPDHPPQSTLTVEDLHTSTLYIWKM